MSNCEVQADQPPATEREFTTTVKFPKISLKIFICSLILCLGFILGFVISELSYTARNQQIDEQNDDIYQHVHLFDTEQKIAEHYKKMEAAWAPPESLFSRQARARLGRDRPLVTVGPFTIFVNNDTGEVSVHESQSPLPLVELIKGGQVRILRLHGLLEEGLRYPRFFAAVTYSHNNIYKQCSMSLNRGNGLSTSFVDNNGMGVFDKMEVWDNGEKTNYRLNGLTWERSDEPPLYLPPPPPPMELPSMNTQ